MKLQGNAVVAQSGGPTAVINSSLSGVVKEWQRSADGRATLYGSLFGIRGVLEDNLLDLGRQSREIIEGLRHTPGAALGSSRYKLRREEDYRRLLQGFKKYNVRYFFYIGGNDSMDTANKVHRLALQEQYEMRVIGIPKTVDNDLPHTDHCPGYGSAAKFVATAVLSTGLDLKNLITGARVVILEAMGRNTGWLAAAAALAKQRPDDAPHLIYFPEIPFDRHKFLEDVKTTCREYGIAYVVVSEGLRTPDGEYIYAGNCTDAFGHVRLGGLADTLKALLESELGITARVIVPGTLQRAAMYCASFTDAIEAYMVGKAAVQKALAGESGIMITLDREGEPGGYRCRPGTVALERVANVEKKVPRAWINGDNNHVAAAFLDYARPLIAGEVIVPARDGLPDYVALAGFDVVKMRRRLERHAVGIAE